jgi:hypothetical protein
MEQHSVLPSHIRSPGTCYPKRSVSGMHSFLFRIFLKKFYCFFNTFCFAAKFHGISIFRVATFFMPFVSSSVQRVRQFPQNFNNFFSGKSFHFFTFSCAEFPGCAVEQLYLQFHLIPLVEKAQFAVVSSTLQNKRDSHIFLSLAVIISVPDFLIALSFQSLVKALKQEHPSVSPFAFTIEIR